MPFSPLGVAHVVSSVVGLASGALLLLSRKGTPGHRRLGWTYVGAMIATNASALMIHRLFGHFGPFHAAAIASLAVTIPAVLPRGRRGTRGAWIRRHYFFATASYAGLVAAAVAETMTRSLGRFSAAAVGTASGVSIVAAVFVIIVRWPMVARRLGVGGD